ncbi:hypothetical protein TNCV_1540511 [Trichonephila clavipes]|nr:hypothetical protein TNCV_1540511 [Trichonephila clavipes]
MPLEIVGSSGHKKVPTRRKSGLVRPGTRFVLGTDDNRVQVWRRPVLTARVSEGKRFSEAVLQVNSASEKGSVLLIEDQTDLHLQC